MKRLLSLLLFLTMVLTLSGCDTTGPYIRRTLYLEKAFSIVPNVTLVMLEKDYVRAEVDEFKKELDKIVVDLDKMFNVQDRLGEENVPRTPLMQVNDNAGIRPVEVDEEIILVLKVAIEAAEMSYCNNCDIALFDPSIAPVWDLWNFSYLYYDPISDNRHNPPSAANISNRLALVDYTKIVIDEENSTVYLEEPGMKLDLGSVVKGYAADKLRDAIMAAGYTKAIIDVGGNIHTLGQGVNPDNSDRPWRMGLQTPYFGFGSSLPNQFGVYELTDQTIVSSGVYERYIKDEDGNEYHHIIDPRTGYPFDNEVISVTIVTTNSMLADALSTVVLALGLDEGMALIEALEGVEAVFVVRATIGNEVYISSGAVSYFTFEENMTNFNYTYKGVYGGN